MIFWEMMIFWVKIIEIKFPQGTKTYIASPQLGLIMPHNIFPSNIPFSLQDLKVVYDKIGALEPAAVNYETVLKPLLDVDREGQTRGTAIQVENKYS